MQDLRPFFASRHFIENVEPGTYGPLQWGANIQCATRDEFNWEEADIVLVGCGEWRGEHPDALYNSGPDAIREELYKL